MSFLKQNWVKVSIGAFVLIVLIFMVEQNDGSQNTAIINNAVQSATPSPTVISEKDPRILALEQSLPRFEDYPAKVYLIPPKPKLVHESNPYGMRFWTLTESWIDRATEYNMAGHYLMDRYGTGIPRVLIIDGLTGKVFHEYGAMYPYSVASSSLVIFDPIDPECFTENGDYSPCYDNDNPRYAVWDGRKFATICEATIKNWEVVSCGEVADKNSELFGKRMVVWTGTVVSKMTYGRLRVKDDDIELKQYGYSEFVVEPNDIKDEKNIEMTKDVKVGDYVGIAGYWTNTTNNMPWVIIDGIWVHNDYKP